ncbi:MAG: UDP-glucose/GDP-mannose dehydrogenase family protein [Thermoplasmatales archaeon]
MKVGVIGLGYVGLVTAAVLADHGNDLVGVDIDSEKIKSLKSGISPIYEPDLNKYLERNSTRLEFSTNYNSLKECDAAFICTPTPTINGRIDTSYVENTCWELKKVNETCTAIIKSTVVPGTARKIIRETGMNVISNPEFTKEGTALDDTEHPDRIIIGGSDTKIAEEIWNFTNSNVIKTTNENAELIKYASNAFLALKISYINEIADLCERISGADVDVIAAGMGLDKRIAPYFLRAGIGFGGSCFPKDTKALLGFAEDLKVPLRLVEATLKVNDHRITHALAMIQRIAPVSSHTKIGILGIAFKGNTDDIRESRSIQIIEELLKLGYRVFAYDPKVTKTPTGSILCNTMEECIDNADVIVIAGEWDEFKSLEDINISKPVIDLKRILSKDHIKNYTGVGLWKE